MLDEFVRVTGYHRKTGVRLLAGKERKSDWAKRAATGVWRGGA